MGKRSKHQGIIAKMSLKRGNTISLTNKNFSNPNQNPNRMFQKSKLIPKQNVSGKAKGSSTAKIILEKKNKVGRLVGPNFKTYYKGTIAKTS